MDGSDDIAGRRAVGGVSRHATFLAMMVEHEVPWGRNFVPHLADSMLAC